MTAPAPSALRIEHHPALAGPLLDEVVSVLDEAATADDVSPLSDGSLAALRTDGPHLSHLVARTDAGVTGYALLDQSAPVTNAELVVHPAFRRRGHGRALVESVLGRGPEGVAVWAHGDSPGAQRLAAIHQFRRARVVLRLARTTAGLPALDPDIERRIRPLTESDLDAFLALNNAAFADHPEQGGWTRGDLQARMAEPWFRADDVLLLPGADGQFDGFVWLKVPAAGPAEVYVVGVAPHAQGRGLGRSLATAGLASLAARGAPTVQLYVDETNSAAMRLYDALGFRPESADVLYTRAAS